MLERLLKRIRQWRRYWGSLHCARTVPATTGTLTLAVCHPSGAHEGPLLRTVFRRGPAYVQMADVEIQGFLDGEVRFERNVATRYHVRMGCEASKPVRGRYEVMRVLQRWDLSSLPREASIRAVRLVLHQEDISSFPHRYPLRWPTDFLLYDVRKPWGPGRGGTERNNNSPPERGDAWWREARSGELPWEARLRVRFRR